MRCKHIFHDEIINEIIMYKTKNSKLELYIHIDLLFTHTISEDLGYGAVIFNKKHIQPRIYYLY